MYNLEQLINKIDKDTSINLKSGKDIFLGRIDWNSKNKILFTQDVPVNRENITYKNTTSYDSDSFKITYLCNEDYLKSIQLCNKLRKWIDINKQNLKDIGIIYMEEEQFQMVDIQKENYFFVAIINIKYKK